MAQSLLSMLAPAPTQDGAQNKATSVNAASKNDASGDENIANEFRMLLADNAGIKVLPASIETVEIVIDIPAEELITIALPTPEDTWLRVNGDEVVAAPLEGIAHEAAIEQIELGAVVIATPKPILIEEGYVQEAPLSAEALIAIHTGEKILVEAPRTVLADDVLPSEYLSSALTNTTPSKTAQSAPIIQASSLEEVEQAIAQLMPTIDKGSIQKTDAAIATKATTAMDSIAAALLPSDANTPKQLTAGGATIAASELETIMDQRISEGKPVPAIHITADGGVILPGGVELTAEEVASYRDNGGIPSELFDVEQVINDMISEEVSSAKPSDNAVKIQDTVAPATAHITNIEPAEADITLARGENMNATRTAPTAAAAQTAAPITQTARPRGETTLDNVRDQLDKIVANQSTAPDTATNKSNVADTLLQRSERFSQIIQNAQMGVIDELLPTPQAAVAPKATGAELAAEFSQTADTSLMIGSEGDELSSSREARRPDFLQARQQQMPAENPVDQVKVQIKQAISTGRDEIRIRLHPMELGLVDVKLDIAADGRVQVTVLADNRETLDTLQRDAKALAEALAEAGLEADTGSMQFSMSQDGEDGSEAQAQRDAKNVDLPEDRAEEDTFQPGILAEQEWTVSEGLDIKA